MSHSNTNIIAAGLMGLGLGVLMGRSLLQTKDSAAKASAQKKETGVIHNDKRVIPFPVAKPSWYPEEPDTEPEYNPQLHLSATVLEMKDTNVFLLNGYDEVKVCPTSGENGQSKLAYTRGFKVLSEEGIRQLRSVIDRLRKYAKGTERSPLTIRCLGYRSKWMRDFNRCPVLLQYLSKLAGQPLMAHSIVSHYAHTNIGIIGSGQPVDQWHVDSVPFVMVLLMSDMTDAVGGKLEVIKDTKENAFKQLAETKNKIPADKLLTAEYPGMGHALFMQGSEMVHHVTSVESAPEPRITVVNSYMPINPFAVEQTYSYTYRHDPTMKFEFARHRAWRVSQQLHQLVDSKQWQTQSACVASLQFSMEELQRSVDILEGKIKDKVGFYQEIEDKPPL